MAFIQERLCGKQIAYGVNVGRASLYLQDIFPHLCARGSRFVYRGFEDKKLVYTEPYMLEIGLDFSTGVLGPPRGVGRLPVP